MGMYMQPRKKSNDSILDIFFGPGVNAGRNFNGRSTKSKNNGAGTYSHVRADRVGNNYVIKGGSSLVRPRNVNGIINPKNGY